MVEEYIVPALLFVSQYFGFSEAFAGVTLLAMANGLGDVATAFVASTSEEGVSFVVGSLYGAGLFVFTVVIMISIGVSPKEIRVVKSVIFRDLGIYLLATLMILGFAMTGKLNSYQSFSFFGVYIAWVAIVVVQEWMNSGKEEASLEEDDEVNSLINDDENARKSSRKRSSERNNVTIIAKLLKNSPARSIFLKFAHVLKKKREVPKIPKQGIIANLYKVLLFIDTPLVWLRKVSILTPPPENLDKNYFLLWPFFGIPVIMWATIGNPNMHWLIYIPFAFLISALFALAISEKKIARSERFQLFIAILSTISSILWTKIVSSILIDVIVFIGIESGLPTSFLSFTVIAVGTALPDSLTTIAIAKKGQAIMGITGAYAGQVFGLLFGFGLSMMNRCYYLGKAVEFDLLNPKKYGENALVILLLIFTGVSLVVTMVWVPLRGFRFEKRMGFVLFLVYVVFMCLSVFFVIRQVFSGGKV